MLLKPAQLVIKRKGDPEQLAKDWQEYVRVFQEFLQATDVAGSHANPETPNNPCVVCVKVKNMLRLVGGDEVRTLFDHVGMVGLEDTWEETLQKISNGIKQQLGSGLCRKCHKVNLASQNGTLV